MHCVYGITCTAILCGLSDTKAMRRWLASDRQVFFSIWAQPLGTFDT